MLPREGAAIGASKALRRLSMIQQTPPQGFATHSFGRAGDDLVLSVNFFRGTPLASTKDASLR
jgi:hypothetical protein